MGARLSQGAASKTATFSETTWKMIFHFPVTSS